MENGPPNSFLNKVPPIFVEDDDVKTSILKTMESVWSSIEDDALRKVYQSAYDTAKDRLGIQITILQVQEPCCNNITLLFRFVYNRMPINGFDTNILTHCLVIK